MLAHIVRKYTLSPDPDQKLDLIFGITMSTRMESGMTLKISHRTPAH